MNISTQNINSWFNKVENKPSANTGLAKVAVQFSADTFVDNQSLFNRINICGKSLPSQIPKPLSAMVN